MSESDARWALRCGGGKQWWRERGGVVWFYLRSQADGKSRVIGGIGGWSFAKPFNGCKDSGGKIIGEVSGALVCSPMVERMVDREEKKFLD
ncbi:hypothetical protein Tco_0355840 [Tanacetum coccineum]